MKKSVLNRFISFLLAFLLAYNLLPFQVLAANEEKTADLPTSPVKIWLVENGLKIFRA